MVSFDGGVSISLHEHFQHIGMFFRNLVLNRYSARPENDAHYCHRYRYHLEKYSRSKLVQAISVNTATLQKRGRRWQCC